MSVSAAGLFSTQSSAGTGHYKPVSGTASTASTASTTTTGGTATVAGKGDTVSMSALGKRLTGAAADLFGALDPKARGMLEDVVNSGKMSADDVVKGLSAIAKNAAADAFVANGLEKNNQKPGFSAAIVAAGAVSEEFSGQRRSLVTAFDGGAMSVEDYTTQMKALTDTVTKRQDELLAPFADTAGKPIVLETGGKPIERPSDGEQAALEKLAQLGFDKPVYRDGASAYGSKFRVPPDGAASSAQAPAGEGGAAASVQTASATTVSVTATSTAASTASPSATPASALDSRVAAGKAAASMLQAALDGGAKPASSLFTPASSAAGTDGGAAASSLLDALKGGAAKTGNSTDGEG